ncbi:hypothetical protein HAX54_016796 [Datura stramonium]|uniref:Uncharacterized protein n=1 Tax=Datura stramonium TaxID=4076 RepID=A0ABS8ULS1_DATST|nr:hypothetical protein [Datura stramonium]
MFSTMASEATRMGISSINWVASNWNESALDFYTQMGATISDDFRVLSLVGKALEAFGDDINKFINTVARCPAQKVLRGDDPRPKSETAFHTQPVALSAIYYHHSKIPFHGDSHSVVKLPSIPLLENEDLPTFISESDAYPTVRRLAFEQNFNFKKADWLLFNTFDVLEEEVINWLRTQYTIKTIGPVVLSTYLDKKNSLKSHQAQLWNLQELARLKRNWFCCSYRREQTPGEFMSKEKEKGLIRGWCPQLDVLAHQAVGFLDSLVDGISTLEAMSLGVPMIGMPQWADQPTNAKYIKDVWQVGVRIKAGKDGVITREEMQVP